MPNTYTRGVTPVGTVRFSHLLHEEMYNGLSTNQYTLMLALEPEDEQKLLEQINQEWERFVKENPERSYPYAFSNGFKSYHDQNYFKFRMSAHILTKRGDWDRTVPIFDSALNNISQQLITSNKELGNGSKVKVSYELLPFYKSEKNYGISLRLLSVQVLEFHEYTMSGESFGFSKEEGYPPFAEGASKPVPADTVDDDYIPF